MGIAGIRKDVLGKAVDDAIDRNIAEGFTTGVLVCVCFDGELVYRRAAGLADREANCPMQEDTLFRLASISNAVLPVSLWPRLWKSEKLSLDDSVSNGFRISHQALQRVCTGYHDQGLVVSHVGTRLPMGAKGRWPLC